MIVINAFISITIALLIACLPDWNSCLAVSLVIAQTSSRDAVNPPMLAAAGVRAWVKVRTGWLEVPVQIDERDANNDYVLENGMPFTAYGGDGWFNGRDEMVIAFPPEAQGFAPDDAARHLKKLTGQRPGASQFKGWILSLENSLTKSNQKSKFMVFVTQSANKNLPGDSEVKFHGRTVSTPFYRYTFDERNPAAIGKLEISARKDIKLDRLWDFQTINQTGTFAIWLRPTWGFPVLQQTDEDISSAVESWRSGPVRTIVAVGTKYSAIWSTVKAHLFSELLFYRDRFQIPSVIDIPFSPRMILGRGSGFAYGLRLTGSVPPKILRLGEGTEAAGSIEVEHPSGLKLKATVDPRLAADGILPQVWSEAENVPDLRTSRGRPEKDFPVRVADWLRQTGANIGFFVDISSMARGRYDFALDLESLGEANQPHTDFLICKSVWAPVEPSKSTQTAAPVPH